MLVELNIENFAIIDNLNITFSNGLNVITGETGSGKSILIEALGIILGSRSNKNLIRAGESESNLEAVFYITDEETILNLKNHEIDISDDNLLIISKKILKDGPSLSKINGRNISLSSLKKITSSLIDIFGQHEHQSLLDTKNHKILLDSMAGEEIKKLKKQTYYYYNEIKSLENKLESLTIDERLRDREIDILKFQIKEISDANLNFKEDENIYSRYKKNKNIQKIQLAFSGLVNNLEVNTYNSSILDLLNINLVEVRNAEEYDETIKEFTKRLEGLIIESEDFLRDVKDYLDKLDYSNNELVKLEERINLINNLKSKYGDEIYEILDFKEKCKERLYLLENQSKEKNNIKSEMKNIENKFNETAKKISSIRIKTAKKLQKTISNELLDLNMKGVNFKISIKKANYIYVDGFDDIEFLISTNIGEELKPLNKIVSGGEMSRIMLAFKKILAKFDKIETLIFDEIDTGISGRTAQIVGEKIKEIAEKHQVICISHLPQLTALAEHHYVISKKTENKKTRTYIRKLNDSERIEELARLIGGANVTDMTLKNAKEIIEMSKHI